MNPTTNTSVVYIIQCGSTDFLKIGYSENLSKRLEALQGASPYTLRVLASWPGGSELEAYLHREFAQLRHAREWFCFPPCRRIEIYNAVMIFNTEKRCMDAEPEPSRRQSLAREARVAFLRPPKNKKRPQGKLNSVNLRERPPMACTCPIPRVAYTEWKISGGRHRYRVMMDRWFEDNVAKYARSEWFTCTCEQMREWRKSDYRVIFDNVRRVREKYFSEKVD